MVTSAYLPPSSHRRALPGRGDVVYPIYWIAAAALIVAALLGLPLNQPAAVAGATLVFIGGGLPHGAYDIALLRRSVALNRSALWRAVGGYVAVAMVMVLLWMTVPLVALVLFLAVASVHFGEDWPMLEEPLLRVAAGAAVIAAATIGHREDVSALFVAMSDPRAAVIAQIVTAAAPVTLLVTMVGIVLAWREGSRDWAAAMALCFVLLVALPPVAGFALFFVFLHSPRHLAQTRALLRDMTLVRWIGTGALLSGLVILGWWGMRIIAPSRFDPSVVAQAFQLLASVAVPHLLLSRWLERRLIAAPFSEGKT
ncbi:Brp/Blh family beta-carotene 15,15'-dioxygenase [Sphingomonas montana]|uniref:Brp/Blh family beta-carotene 15,15'-dioxygenase n=1 Tax=Sphingomonas montana TaxID=1843236 RepID=UPI00096C1F5B|nr:Brp/Blh family beta-carotene 15,15'-dioxygenase [Sphingomonas montana]